MLGITVRTYTHTYSKYLLESVQREEDVGGEGAVLAIGGHTVSLGDRMDMVFQR